MAVITISRHPGSLGDTIARALAERLHYRLVERAELVQLAERIGGPDVAWARAPELRERSPTFWERLNDERRRYASVLRRAVTQLAEEGDVVIVGLGGGQLLKGQSNVLRLQLIAPPDVRLERVMARGFDDVKGPLSRDRARELIRSTDRDTSGYMRYLFHIDWIEPQHWDLVINTGRFSVEETVEIVTTMVASDAFQPSLLGADAGRLEEQGDSIRRAPTDESAGSHPERQLQRRSALEEELALHERNLERLRALKGVYAEGEELLDLVNQIEAEERDIRLLESGRSVPGRREGC